MKKILLLALSAFSFNAFSQTIPNNDFENWTTHTDPGSTGIVVDSLESGYWESGNPLLITLPSLAAGLPKGFMYDTSYAYSGNHAVAMRSGFLNGLVATGHLFNGVIDESINGIQTVLMTLNPLAPATTGAPSTMAPSSFKGYYFYQPSDQYLSYDTVALENDSLFGTTDTCVIACIVHKWDNVNMKRDTIAYGEMRSYQTSTAWMPFDIPLTYNQVAGGDSISVLFLASSQGLRFAGAPNSLLIVDSVYFEGDYLSLNKNDLKERTFYFTEEMIFCEGFKGESIQIFDMIGRKVDEIRINNEGVSNYTFNRKGSYIARLSKNNTVIRTIRILNK